jgi:EAL domain-containing protein (putative c-di-GMP-specific phosphodiesterase class I)
MRKLGCDLAQGDAFAHPAPAAEIEGLLAGGQPLTEAA